LTYCWKTFTIYENIPILRMGFVNLGNLVISHNVGLDESDQIPKRINASFMGAW
jgi:hypothetical protein